MQDLIPLPLCHAGEGRHPEKKQNWIPAFARDEEDVFTLTGTIARQSKIPRMRGTGMTELNVGRIPRMRRNGLFGEQSL